MLTALVSTIWMDRLRWQLVFIYMYKYLYTVLPGLLSDNTTGANESGNKTRVGWINFSLLWHVLEEIKATQYVMLKIPCSQWQFTVNVSLCLYACLLVTSFTIKIYRFKHSLRTSLAPTAYEARSRSIEDSKGRRRQQNESRCMKDGG